MAMRGEFLIFLKLLFVGSCHDQTEIHSWDSVDHGLQTGMLR